MSHEISGYFSALLNWIDGNSISTSKKTELTFRSFCEIMPCQSQKFLMVQPLFGGSAKTINACKFEILKDNFAPQTSLPFGTALSQGHHYKEEIHLATRLNFLLIFKFPLRIFLFARNETLAAELSAFMWCMRNSAIYYQTGFHPDRLRISMCNEQNNTIRNK